jgi:hypothetical protein
MTTLRRWILRNLIASRSRFGYSYNIRDNEPRFLRFSRLQKCVFTDILAVTVG